MTVGAFFSKGILFPILITIPSYPIYDTLANGVPFFVLNPPLHGISLIITTAMIVIMLGFLLCYTICNWNEDIKTWLVLDNMKFYLKYGRPNYWNEDNKK